MGGWVGGGWCNFTPPCLFSLNNSEMVETLVLNLVFLTQPSLQILGKTQTGVFPVFGRGYFRFSDGGIPDFRISGQSLIKGNCHNSRTSDDIDMKVGPVTKLDKRNKTTSKMLMITSCRKIAMSLPFFQFTANLEQSGSRIPDA